METAKGTKIIGGMFGLGELPSYQLAEPPFLKGNCVYLATARSGITLLIELLSPARVWLPSYLCGIMVEAVDQRKADVRFYAVNYDLNIASSDWLDEVQRNDLVVFVDYFGFPCDPDCMKRAKEQEAWILEDACQALLSEEVGRFSDFVLFSPRKVVGVPEGGILVLNRGISADSIKLETPPTEWWLKAFSASVLRREFDLYGGSRRWFDLFRETEVQGPIKPYAMSEFSRTLLQHSFDYSTIANRRIDNFVKLAHELGEFAIFPALPHGVVPLGFPVRVKDRDRVRQALFSHEIYPPVHWPIQGVVPEKFTQSHRLCSDIMTLPCDQRYDNEDMERLVAVFLSEVA